jgi:AraC family transcriptional regulator
MIKHFFLAILLGIIFLLAYLAYHVGYFKSVTIEEISGRQFVLVGLSHQGAYHEIVSKIQQVESKIQALGGVCDESFGLYLDDPREVEQDRLKSFGGCVVKDPEWMLSQVLNLQGFQVLDWKAETLIQAYFEGSPGIGAFKVYPKVYQYAQGKRLTLQKTVLEVYQRIQDSKKTESQSQPENLSQGESQSQSESLVTHYYFPLSGLESPVVSPSSEKE